MSARVVDVSRRYPPSLVLLRGQMPLSAAWTRRKVQAAWPRRAAGPVHLWTGIGVLARRSLGCCLPWRLVDRAQHLDAMARAEIDENSGRVSTV